MNGKVTGNGTSDRFQVRVDLSFGNCPKYIQAREPSLNIEKLAAIGKCTNSEQSNSLNASQKRFLKNADTFFIASGYFGDSETPSSGIDVSHRGGKPGFVQVIDKNTIQWPDYLGK